MTGNIVFLFSMISSLAKAGEFQSSFKDNSFCNFDLQRMPFSTNADALCGPEFAAHAKIKKHREESYVAITMDNQVPFSAKYKYKMELSVPKEHHYRDGESTEHRFSFLIPHLPVSEKIFADLPADATAFVLAQWHACNEKSPPLALRLMNSKELALTIDIDVDQSDSEETKRLVLWQKPAVVGEPLFFVVLASWSLTEGKLSVGMNNESIVEYTGVLGQRDSESYYFKYGLYHSYKDQITENFSFMFLLGELSQWILPKRLHVAF